MPYYKPMMPMLVAPLVCTSLITKAEEPKTNANFNEQAIGTLHSTTVIARRAEHSIGDTTSKLHVLQVDELQDSGIYSVSSALQKLPGVNVSSASQEGTSQGVRIRGLRPNDTQFRIDGVRFTRRLGNLDSFISQLSSNGFSKIELLKGSQSSLYGSSANGGVINLTTKSGSASPSGKSSLEAGSFNTLSLEMEQGGSFDKLSYFFSSRLSTTDNDTYRDNSETGGYDNDFTSAQHALRLSYKLRKDLALGFTLRRQEGEVETPQFGGSRVENEFYLSTLYADYQINDQWKSKFTLSSLIENSHFINNFSTIKTDYQQIGLSWENSYQHQRFGSLSFGTEYEHQDYTGFGVPNGLTDHYLAFYLSHAYEINSSTLETAIRYEDYRSFGDAVTWRVGVAHKIDSTHTTLKGSVATGFNTPNFIQLFSPLAFGLAGNPNLSPETSFGWELTLEQELTSDHVFSVSLFETDIERAITPDFAAGLYANNAGRRKASGIELSLQGSITPSLSYLFDYTWLDRSIDGQPEQTINAQLELAPTPKLKLGLGMQYLDQRSYGGNLLPDAFIARAYTSYQATEAIRLHTRIENFTDTEYSHVSFGSTDYPARRIGAYAGVSITW